MGETKFDSVLERHFPKGCEDRVVAERLLSALKVDLVKLAGRVSVGEMGRNVGVISGEDLAKLDGAERMCLKRVNFRSGDVVIEFESLDSRMKAFLSYVENFGRGWDSGKGEAKKGGSSFNE